jgi:hypothetical protein
MKCPYNINDDTCFVYGRWVPREALPARPRGFMFYFSPWGRYAHVFFIQWAKYGFAWLSIIARYKAATKGADKQ